MRSTADCHPRRVGFTLMEMTIVVVILGIIAVMGLPRFAAELRHSRVVQAANVVAADLELAGSLAAESRRPIRLRWSPSRQDYEIAFRDSSVILARRSFAGGTEWHVDTASFEPGTIDFFPGGTLSAPVQVVLASAGARRVISVSRAGLVKVGT